MVVQAYEALGDQKKRARRLPPLPYCMHTVCGGLCSRVTQCLYLASLLRARCDSLRSTLEIRGHNKYFRAAHRQSQPRSGPPGCWLSR